MTHLHQQLGEAVDGWRDRGYPHEAYDSIAEILEYAVESETGNLRYLRRAQFRALETYWYLRLVLGTPTIPKLYERLYPKRKDQLAAMGISPRLFEEADYDFENLIERVLNDNAFVRRHKLESLRETLNLEYPSYILALAMGAGKTYSWGPSSRASSPWHTNTRKGLSCRTRWCLRRVRPSSSPCASWRTSPTN